jgi:hypothetical protein
MKKISLTRGEVDYKVLFKLLDYVEFYTGAQPKSNVKKFNKDWRWSSEFRCNIGWYMIIEGLKRAPPYQTEKYSSIDELVYYFHLNNHPSYHLREEITQPLQ